MKILQATDRPGWAIDKLSKPLGENLKNVDVSYHSIEGRVIHSGYTHAQDCKEYSTTLANEYDIVHFHRLEAAIRDLHEVNKSVRKIISIHTQRPAELIDERILNFDDVVCSTKKAYNVVKENFANSKLRVWYVPYGIDKNKFFKIENFEKERNNILGFVGRVAKWKRFDVIQKAAYDAQMFFKGCGYVHDSNFYNVHNLKKGSFYFSVLEKEELINSFYNNMSIFGCLSVDDVEAGPLPLLEAMSCGIPVISTKIGMAVDFCTHLKDIFFVEENEINNLSEIIKDIYNNKQLLKTLSENGLKLSEKFDIKNYCSEINKIYMS